MCTLTWRIEFEPAQGSSKLIIVANRDESKQRPPALPPQQFNEGASRFVMPVDPQGGGSWIATNEHGLTIAILNYYAADAKFKDSAIPLKKRSRGLLVKDLAACPSLIQAEAQLAELNLHEYAPFHLLVFAGAQHPIWWSWNGQQLRQKLLNTGVLSTSAWGSNWVPAIRERYLQRRLSELNNLEEHLALLRDRRPMSSSIAVAMEREEAMTVSTTVIEVSRTQSAMAYYAGHPSHQKNSVDVQLARHSEALHTPEQYMQASWKTRIAFTKLFHERAPKLSKSLPSFVFPLLKRVLKERELNRLFSVFDKVAPEHFCDTALQEIGVHVHVKSRHWPSLAERPLFVSNHPSGGLDGIALIAVLRKRYPNLRVVANDVLTQIAHMQDWVIPVNVFGNPKQSLKDLQTAFAGNEPILMFPAGKTARRNAARCLDDGDWSGVPIKLAARTQRTVVPLYLLAHNSKKFDWIAKWRQKLGVQMNIEMLLLVRELMRPACRDFRVLQGRSIQGEALAQVASEKRPGELMKEKSYALQREASI